MGVQKRFCTLFEGGARSGRVQMGYQMARLAGLSHSPVWWNGQKVKKTSKNTGLFSIHRILRFHNFSVFSLPDSTVAIHELPLVAFDQTSKKSTTPVSGTRKLLSIIRRFRPIFSRAKNWSKKTATFGGGCQNLGAPPPLCALSPDRPRENGIFCDFLLPTSPEFPPPVGKFLKF